MQEKNAKKVTGEPAVYARRKASWARLIQKVYEFDPLKRLNCGATMHIIALIDDAEVVERILKHLKLWYLSSETITLAGADHTFGAKHPFTGRNPRLVEAMNATQAWFLQHLVGP